MYNCRGRDLRPRKPLEFVGRSLEELRDFPPDARGAAGYQLDQVQAGATPVTAKPMPEVGKGCWEIRVAEDDGWFRVFYVASLGDVIFVLHAFQKKSNKTPGHTIETGKRRYRMAEAIAAEEE
ncbi:type II toxin-antitoxin system RelE/ParE family toxin [Nocardia vermiculata]|uniref:Type II toxin-antitoxin system RelE/ParE family toxin n=1 Tax=Nocardia vermiculata TaxID=257274 RepID=A0A846Y3X3_9NOCA|nr:type II toxin-antitoxin system RelE/ParE family toxin [Nocardia vermiculata]